MRSLRVRAWAWVMMALACLAPLAPEMARAQAAASPYTMGYRWDALRRLVGQISPNAASSGTASYPAIRYSYDVNGQLVTTERGVLAAWQAETVAPSAWSGFTVLETTTLSYDAVGNKIQEVLKTAAGGTQVQSATQTSYDEDDRPYCVATRMNLAAVPALPASYSKTFACTLGSTGGSGQDRIVKTVYDAAGQVTQVRRAVATSLEQAYATYTFTPNGKQAFVTDANGNKARLCYDGYDRQSRWLFPSKTTAGSTSGADDGDTVCAVTAASDYEDYGYDANGNRIALRKRDGQAIAYGYDALDRMVSKDLPNAAADVSYGYDLAGRQTSATFTATGQGIASVFDNADRLTSSTNTTGGTSRQLQYQYDRDGNRIQLTFPDAKYFTYGYDGLDRLATVKESGSAVLVALAYDDLGRRSCMVRGAAVGANCTGGVVRTSYGYDGAGRLGTLGHQLATTTANVTYTLAYNPAAQLVSRQITNDGYAAALPVAANDSYAVNGLNQYKTGPSSYDYDPNGNLTSDGATTFAYDTENRLTGATGGKTANLIYDPLGRLFETNTGASGITRFLYDGDNLVGEYNSAGTLLRRYVPGAGQDEPLVWYEGATVSSATRRYLLADHQGSIVAVANGSGTSLGINAYDSWGVANATNIGRFQYTGQISIPEVGLYHYKARVYDPRIGRFYQTDPIGYQDQINLYTYVGNDPVNGRDPNGKRIKVDSAEDQKIIENQINMLTRAKYGFDSKGNLYKISDKGGEGKSTYYDDRLNQGIDNEKTINISIADTYINQSGITVDLNGPPGGAITLPSSGGNVRVVTTGREWSGFYVARNPLNSRLERNSAQTNLAHELVGHAIPRITGPGTGNAIDDENRVRLENGIDPRGPDSDHIEVPRREVR